MKRRRFHFWIVLVVFLFWRLPTLLAEEYRWVDSMGIVHYSPVRNMIITAASRLEVDPALVEAIVAVESSFDPRAISPKGAIGLMQLMPQTASRYDVSDPFDPQENLTGGTRYLRDLLSRFGGDLPQVLAAYNAGEAAVFKYQGVPPYRETREYIQKVLALYRPERVSSSIPSIEQETHEIALVRVEPAENFRIPDVSQREASRTSSGINSVSRTKSDSREGDAALVQKEAKDNFRLPDVSQREGSRSSSENHSVSETEHKRTTSYRPLTRLTPPPLVRMRGTRTVIVKLRVHRYYRTRPFPTYSKYLPPTSSLR